MNPIDVQIDAIYDKLAELAEAHNDYVGGCLDEDEYLLVCEEADKLNNELESLLKFKKENEE